MINSIIFHKILDKIYNIKYSISPISISLNFFLYCGLLSYLLGPFFLNLYITILSLASLYNIFFKKVFYLEDFLFSLILLIIFINILLSSIFNSHILSFLRFFFIFLTIDVLIKDKAINITPLIFGVVILCLDSIFQYYFGQNILGFEKYENFRLTSFFDDEPIIGSFLFKLFAPLLFFYFCAYKKYFNSHSSKILFIFSFFLCFITIFLSGERMAFIQITFVLLLTLLFLKKYKLILSVIILFLILYFLLDLFDLIIFKRIQLTLSQIFLALLTNDFNYDLLNKFYLIKPYLLNFGSGLDVWKENLLIGGGYRFYNQYCAEFLLQIKSNYIEGCSTHPHNIYIEILSDFGLVGIILFSALFITPLIRFLFLLPINREYFGFFILFIALSFPFFSSQSIFSSYYGSLFFIYFSTCKIISIKKLI